MAATKQKKGHNAGPLAVSNTANVIICIILGLFCLSCVLPVLLVYTTSFTDELAITKNGVSLFPETFSFEAYRMLFGTSGAKILTSYRNTILITVLGTVFGLWFMTMYAYACSRKDFKFRQFLSFYAYFTMLFSGGMIPAYLNVRDLGMMDTLLALIMPNAINTSNLLIMRSAFMSVPESLSEAAEIDGASHRQILFQVMVPLVKATMAVLVLYYGVAHWNSWFNASIYLRSSDKFPLQLVLRNILIEGETSDMLSDVGSADNPQAVQLLKYSLIVVSTLPIMCIYPFLQRFFEKGVMLGAVKG
mgnify:CR=1 FL=1